MLPQRTRISIGICILTLGALLGVLTGAATRQQDASALQAPARNASMEASFISAVNQTRAQRGAGPLTPNGGMSSAALSWTYSMASGTFLAHASDIVSGTPPGWTKVGENVGRGQTVQTLMTAFMNSPTHAQNLLDPSYTHIGVGVYIHPNGRVYTTHRFAALPGVAAAPVAPAPTATPIPPPPPTLPPAPTVPPAPTPIPPPPPTATPIPPAPTATPIPPAPTATPIPPPAPTATANPADENDGFGQAPEQLAFNAEQAQLSPDQMTSWFETIEQLFAQRTQATSAQPDTTVHHPYGIQ